MSDKYKNNSLLDEHLTNIPEEESGSDPYFWKRVGGLFIATIVLGGISAWARPFFDAGIHVEAVLSLIALIGMNINLLRYFIREKRKHYQWAYLLGTVAIWMGYCFGWSLISIRVWGDVLTLNGTFALGALAIGKVVFYYDNKRFGG